MLVNLILSQCEHCCPGKIPIWRICAQTARSKSWSWHRQTALHPTWAISTLSTFSTKTSTRLLLYTCNASMACSASFNARSVFFQDGVELIRSLRLSEHLNANSVVGDSCMAGLLPEVAGVTFSDSDSAPVQKFLNPDLEIFKFEIPTLVQAPATIDPTVIHPCFYLRNDRRLLLLPELKSDSGSGVRRNFWLAKFLTSHHVRMRKVIFYISNTLIKLINMAQEFVFR